MNRKSLIPLVVVAIVLALAACHKSDNQPFAWQSTATQGEWIRIRDLNGEVTVQPSSDDLAHVTATISTSGRGGWLMRPERVHFTTVSDGQNMTICAIWGDDGRCSATSYSTHHNFFSGLLTMRKSALVHFIVSVPAGVKIDASSVNGPIVVQGATSDVIARTVNGPVSVTANGGPVSAQTVNGPVMAHVGALTEPGDLTFKSVNGPVTVYLPAEFDADVVLSTVNGSIAEAQPLTTSGTMTKHHIEGRMGAGGRKLSAETVNGSVTLRGS